LGNVWDSSWATTLEELVNWATVGSILARMSGGIASVWIAYSKNKNGGVVVMPKCINLRVRYEYRLPSGAARADRAITKISRKACI